MRYPLAEFTDRTKSVHIRMVLGEIPPISVNTTFGLFDSEGLLFLGLEFHHFSIFSYLLVVFFRRAPAAIRVCVS